MQYHPKILKKACKNRKMFYSTIVYSVKLCGIPFITAIFLHLTSFNFRLTSSNFFFIFATKKMDKMIYIDCDDVLAESTLSYIDLVKREFGIERKFEELTSFDLRESFGLTQQQFDHFFDLVHKREEILKFEPLPGSIEVLNKWHQNGYKLAIVTGRITAAYDSTLEWLEMHKVPYDTFMVVDKYHRPEMDMSIAKSLDYLRTLKFSFAIEDSLSMSKFLALEMNLNVALVNRPWNSENHLDSKIRRVDSWVEIQERFSSLISSKHIV